MSDRHLRMKPNHRKRQPDWWWYEEPKGLVVVVHQNLTNGRTVVVDIPWRTLRAALGRKDRP